MGIPLDSRFLSLVVHDLRTPLNVIGLTLRLIDQAVPKGNADLEEDLRVLQENVAQIERMLAHLTEFSRLHDESLHLKPMKFDPKRLLAEVVEEQAIRSPETAPQLEMRGNGPAEVELDPTWARQAIRHALENATSSADGAPTILALGGTPDRLVIELTIDRAPPATVQPTRLRPGVYERLFGSAHERRGLDLALSARISELFGGEAWLKVAPGQSSTIVLDWPAQPVSVSA